MPLHFTLTEYKLTDETFQRFMDDSFVFSARIKIFRELLNELQPH